MLTVSLTKKCFLHVVSIRQARNLCEQAGVFVADEAFAGAVSDVAPDCLLEMDEDAFVRVTLKLVGLDKPPEAGATPPVGSVQSVKLRRASVAALMEEEKLANEQSSACCVVS